MPRCRHAGKRRGPGRPSRSTRRGTADAEPRRERLVEKPRFLARLEGHRLADEARGPLPVRRRLQATCDALAQPGIEIAGAVAGRTRDLREREGVRLGTRPVRGDEPLGPARRDLPGDDAVDGPVERHPRAEAGERPELLLGGPAPYRLGHERLAQLGALDRAEASAAADRLPHLAKLLRPRSWPLRPPAAEQRRPQLLREVLLLPRGEPAGDSLPEVPPFGAALDRARVAQRAGEHAPEPAHAKLVAGIAETRPEKEADQVEPPCLVLRRAGARRLERPERVPERTDRRERPRVAAGTERALEPPCQRDRLVVALEGRAQQSARFLDPFRLEHERGLGPRRRLRLDRLPQPELEPPAMLGRPRAAPHLERADLRQPDLDVYRQRRLLELP